MNNIDDMRHQFETHSELVLNALPENPLNLFEQWFEDARNSKMPDPNAFVLSTANATGRLRSRTVLLKYFDNKGFVFYTNYSSQKALDMNDYPYVAVCFPWYGLERQVMIEGCVEKISQMESLKYFSSRPRGSQIGAWVSEQSKAISSRAILMDKVKQLTEHFKGRDVTLPDFWGGYRIKPTCYEFWQGQPNRLHDRIEYLGFEEKWKKQRLCP